MKSGKEIGEELNDIHETFYGRSRKRSNMFGGANVGLAIAGHAIANAILKGLSEIAFSLSKSSEKEKECEHKWIKADKDSIAFYYICEKCDEEMFEKEEKEKGCKHDWDFIDESNDEMKYQCKKCNGQMIKKQ